MVKLESFPALAIRLSEPAGIKFEHMSFDKGRIRMVVEGDVVTLKFRTGSIAKKSVGSEM